MRLNPGTEAAGVVGGAEGGVGRAGLGAGGGEDRLSAGWHLISTPSQGADLCRWQGLPPAARTRQLLPGEEEPLPWEGCLWRLPRGRHRSLGRLAPASWAGRRKQHSHRVFAGPGPRKRCSLLLTTSCGMRWSRQLA